MSNVAGVDEENRDEVCWCTRTPLYDKVAREAVRKMFRELKPKTSHDGLERVPKSAFTESAAHVAKNKTEMKLLMKAGLASLRSLFCWRNLARFVQFLLVFCS